MKGIKEDDGAVIDQEAKDMQNLIEQKRQEIEEDEALAKL